MTTPTIHAPDTLVHRCEESLVFGVSKQRAYDALHRVDAWPKHLPHVRKIELLYDDGQYQEFYMEVESNGGRIRVRSVRNCREARIDFFQPEPPVFLRHHAGSWEFQAIGADACRVVATHAWDLDPEVAAARFPATPASSTAEQVAVLLLEHARLALGRWKQVLETEQPGQGEASW